VERARRGDEAAWIDLYRASYGVLVAFAARRLGSVEEAREAVSETMARAVASLERFQGDDAGFQPWLFGILRHVVGDTYRLRSRLSVQTLREGAWDGPDLDDLLILEADHVNLRAAFARLDPGDQEILLLRVVGQLSSEEVADVLGKGPSAVRMAQMRAIGRLRSFLEETERVS
jgi:RNA polymerase sigma-70 factor (ECF subfamily)